MPTRSWCAATSRTCVSSCPRGLRFTIRDVPTYRPIGSTAARLFARRWPLYVGTCAAVFGLEALFYANVHVRLAEYCAF